MTRFAPARFKELCLDTAEDGEALGRFWAAATGCEYVASGRPGEPGDVVGAAEGGSVEGRGIAICPVPEPKTVKHRVHLDVYTDAVDTLLGLGATLAPGYPTDKWTVLLDPEGGELCAFLREEPPAYRVCELVVDSADPERIARWWAEVFGVPVLNEGQPWWWLEDVPGMPFEYWVFQPAPEPKTVKNRLHWDVYGDPAALLEAGATHLWDEARWTTLADPEGNEFCVFTPTTD